MSIDQLDNCIRQGKLEEAMELIASIDVTEDEAYLDLLIKHLKTTEHATLRNEIAIALSDLGNDKAVDALMEVALQPGAQGSRGTLLYALEELNYVPYISDIVGFIGDSSHETSMQAFLLLEDIVEELSGQDRAKCKKVLELNLANDDYTNKEHVTEALEML